jgi:hypothetical protein
MTKEEFAALHAELDAIERGETWNTTGSEVIERMRAALDRLYSLDSGRTFSAPGLVYAVSDGYATRRGELQTYEIARETPDPYDQPSKPKV